MLPTTFTKRFLDAGAKQTLKKTLYIEQAFADQKPKNSNNMLKSKNNSKKTCSIQAENNWYKTLPRTLKQCRLQKLINTVDARCDRWMLWTLAALWTSQHVGTIEHRTTQENCRRHDYYCSRYNNYHYHCYCNYCYYSYCWYHRCCYDYYVWYLWYFSYKILGVPFSMILEEIPLMIVPITIIRWIPEYVPLVTKPQ